MNAQDRKLVWRALLVTVGCVVAAWLFTWKAPGRWDFFKGCIVMFGLAHAVGEMREIKKARIQPEGASEKKD
jgi:hypothetical protein